MIAKLTGKTKYAAAMGFTALYLLNAYMAHKGPLVEADFQFLILYVWGPVVGLDGVEGMNQAHATAAVEKAKANGTGNGNGKSAEPEKP